MSETYRSIEKTTADKFIDWGDVRVAASKGAFRHSDHMREDVQNYTNLETYYYRCRLSEVSEEDLQEQHEQIKQTIAYQAEKVVTGGGFWELVEAFRSKPEMLSKIKRIMLGEEYEELDSELQTEVLTNIKNEDEAVEEKRKQARGGVVFLSDHSNLMDIALLGGAIYTAIDDPRAAKSLGIVINKMLGYLDVVIYEGETPEETISIPAIQILQTYSEVITVIPPGESREKYELEEFANKFNVAAGRQLLNSLISGGGVIVAASGGVDDIQEREYETRVNQKRVEDTTARIISIGSKYALKIVTYLDMETKKLHFHIGDELIEMDSPERVHEIMRSMGPDYAILLEESGRPNPTILYGDEPTWP